MKKKGYFLALLIILVPLSYWAGSVGNDAESQTGSEDALLSVNLAQEQEIASLEQEISSLNDNISQQEAQISSHVEEIDILNSEISALEAEIASLENNHNSTEEQKLSLIHI